MNTNFFFFIICCGDKLSIIYNEREREREGERERERLSKQLLEPYIF